MYPILYERNEKGFTTNGIGKLSDAVFCEVTEQRNGMYELEMRYPVSGVHFDEITEERILYSIHSDSKREQPFRIYKITKPLNGIVTVYARHISYDLNHSTVMPYSAGTCANALASIKTYTVGDQPFTFSTDKYVSAAFAVEKPSSIRSILGGNQGSILDIYDGEYEWDHWNVILRNQRGSDKNVYLRYGKNITELEKTTDLSESYAGIVPFWASQDTVVTLPEKAIYSDHVSDFATVRTMPVDFTTEWQEAPSVAQLRTRAQEYLTKNKGWEIDTNITVSFVELWQTEEYANIAPLERVELCDYVHVIHTELGVEALAEVVSVTYDVILERYSEMEIGNAKSGMGSKTADQAAAEAVEESKTHMQIAVEHATKLITGGLGGHVVINTNANGQPNEILIMDTADKSTAVNVIRMNMNGIGFSKNGYNGPFTSAWTIDGHFVADFIDTGTLNANVIRTGVLRGSKGVNYWDLDSGELVASNGKFKLDANGNLSASSASLSGSFSSADGDFTVDTSGNVVAKGTFSAANSKFTIDANGNMSAQNATLTGASVNGTFTSTGGNFSVDANGNVSCKGTFASSNNRFTIDSRGYASMTGASISGTVTTESSGFKMVLENGFLRCYYNNSLVGSYGAYRWGSGDTAAMIQGTSRAGIWIGNDIYLDCAGSSVTVERNKNFIVYERGITFSSGGYSSYGALKVNSGAVRLEATYDDLQLYASDAVWLTASSNFGIRCSNISINGNGAYSGTVSVVSDVWGSTGTIYVGESSYSVVTGVDYSTKSLQFNCGILTGVW